jgi:cytochrome c
MKTPFNAILYTALTLGLLSCNGAKKEDQNFGKPAATEATASTTNTAEFPLADKGKALFEGRGTCTTCHRPDVKLVGPSLQDIVKTYKENKASIAEFLKGDNKPLVDPTQFEVMKANFALTKTMTDEERLSLEQYIYSQTK